MTSEFMKKYLEDRRQLDQGYISHREFDRRSGYENRLRVLHDLEWQRFFKGYAKLVEESMKKLDKTK